MADVKIEMTPTQTQIPDPEDSAELLRDKFKEARAKVIAKMLTPKRSHGMGYSLARVINEFKTVGEKQCKWLYVVKHLNPHQVSAEYFHLLIWKDIFGPRGLRFLSKDIFRSYGRLASEDDTPRSPEYAAFFASAERDEGMKAKRTLFHKVNRLMSEYSEEDTPDVGLLIKTVWKVAGGAYADSEQARARVGEDADEWGVEHGVVGDGVPVEHEHELDVELGLETEVINAGEDSEVNNTIE